MHNLIVRTSWHKKHSAIEMFHVNRMEKKKKTRKNVRENQGEKWKIRNETPQKSHLKRF